jgi:putative DNA primase/helicase
VAACGSPAGAIPSWWCSTTCRASPACAAAIPTELQRFLQLQRSLGRTVLLVHHANSRGTLRGGSRREDVIDLVLALRPPGDWTAAHGARFEIHVEKARNVHGAALQPVVAALHAESHEQGPHWDVQPLPGDRLDRAVALLAAGTTAEATGLALGVSRATAYRLQQRARRLGRLAQRRR